MKNLTAVVLIVSILIGISPTTGFSQSKSYQALREKFQGMQDVYAFHTSGFFARSVLWIAGEHEFKHAIEEVRDLRLVVIPGKLFHREHVSLNGFKRFARKEGFEDIAYVKDHGDDVTLMIQSASKSRNNRYLLIVEDGNEVVVIEIQGYINPDVLLDNEHIAYNK